MKAIIIDETTFQLCEITLTGFNNQDREIGQILQYYISQNISKDVLQWLNEEYPDHTLTAQGGPIDERSHKVELRLTFERPADAFAFKMRWL